MKTIKTRPGLGMESGPWFATEAHEPIDLPEQVLTMIVRLLRDEEDDEDYGGLTRLMRDEEDDARSLYTSLMGGLGSASAPWRRLVKGVLMEQLVCSFGCGHLTNNKRRLNTHQATCKSNPATKCEDCGRLGGPRRDRLCRRCFPLKNDGMSLASALRCSTSARKL
jgi:hypothetical protein